MWILSHMSKKRFALCHLQVISFHLTTWGPCWWYTKTVFFVDLCIWGSHHFHWPKPFPPERCVLSAIVTWLYELVDNLDFVLSTIIKSFWIHLWHFNVDQTGFPTSPAITWRHLWSLLPTSGSRCARNAFLRAARGSVIRGARGFFPQGAWGYTGRSTNSKGQTMKWTFHQLKWW